MKIATFYTESELRASVISILLIVSSQPSSISSTGYHIIYILFQVLLCMVKTFMYCKQVIFTDIILAGRILYFLGNS